MKLMKYFTLLVAAAGIMSACESDLEKVQTLPDNKAVAPVLHELSVSEVNITPENVSTKLAVEWDVADFGESILFTTDIYLAYGDAEVAIITGLDKKVSSYEITYTQIQTIVSKTVEDGGLGIAADTQSDVKMRLGSKVGTTGTTLYSDYATLKVTYTLAKEDEPAEDNDPEGGEGTEGDDTTEGGEGTEGGENTEGDGTTEGEGTTDTPEGDDTTTEGDDTTTEGDDTEGGEDTTEGDTPVENN